MKKLTAGIFSVLVGLVASNAADAAVASKGYVDKVTGANATAISELSETVTANKTAAEDALSTYSATTNQAISDMDAAYKLADQGLQSQIDTKQVALKVATDSPLKLDDQGNLSLEGIASDTELANLTQTVEGHTTTLTTLTGDATNADSVAGQIANAVTALEAKDTELNNAISANTAKFGEYTNTTDMNSAIATAKSEAIAETTALANGAVKSNTDAIAAINNADTGLLKQAKDYADGLSTNVSGNVTALDTRVTTAESEIDGLQASLAEGGVTANAIKAAADAAAAADTKAQGAVETNTTQQGEIDALESADAAQDLEIAKKIPQPDAQCSSPTNYCVLTYNNTGYYWEVIERVDGESLPGGGTYSTQP